MLQQELVWFSKEFSKKVAGHKNGSKNKSEKDF